MTDDPSLYRRIAPDVKLGKNVKIFAFTNLYGCEIGDDTKIGTFVEVQTTPELGNAAKSRVIHSFAKGSPSKTKFSSAIT